MTKPRKTAKNGALGAVPVQPAPAPLPDSDNFELPDALALINSLVNDGQADNWDFRVYQVAGPAKLGGKQSYLFAVTLDELPDLEMTLADNYPAGGKFKVSCRRNNQLVRSFEMEIAARPGYRPKPSYLAAAPEAPAAPAEPPRDRFEQMMTMMMEQQRQFQQTLVTALAGLGQREHTPAPDPLSMLNSMMGVFKEFQGTMPKVSNETNLKMLTDGIALGKEIAGSAPEAETGIMAMLGKVLQPESIEAILKGLSAPRQVMQPPPAPPALAGPRVIANGNFQQPPQHGPQAMVRAGEIGEGERAQLRAGMDYLFTKAAAGADPALLVEEILPMIPQSVFDKLTEVDQPIDWLQDRFPRVGQHRAWFEGLLANIFEEDVEGEQGDDSGQGDDDNQSAGQAVQQPANQ